MIENYSSIALYNADKKEPIGLFINPSTATRYLFPISGTVGANSTRICSALRTKTRICNSRFSFPVAVRVCIEKQKQLLDGQEFIIFNDYPLPPSNFLKRYTSTQQELKKGAIERQVRFRTEQKRIKLSQ